MTATSSTPDPNDVPPTLDDLLTYRFDWMVCRNYCSAIRDFDRRTDENMLNFARRAMVDGAVVAYCRPFSQQNKNDGTRRRRAGTVFELTDATQVDVHDYLISFRNGGSAHSDEQFRIVRALPDRPIGSYQAADPTLGKTMVDVLDAMAAEHVNRVDDEIRERSTDDTSAGPIIFTDQCSIYDHPEWHVALLGEDGEIPRLRVTVNS